MSAEVPSVRPIEMRSVSEQVTNELRRSILNGALAPGQSLSLRTLAEMLNVSLIPVRDALRALESEGLIVNPPGRSARVADLDLDELHAVYRIRRLLEPEMARGACPLLSEEELDELYALATSLGAPDRNMDDIYDDHRALHMALLRPAATAWDERILTTLWRAAERYVRIGFGLLDPDPEEHARRREAHQELVDAFRRHDPDQAASALDQHLVHNEELAAEVLRKKRSEA